MLGIIIDSLYFIFNTLKTYIKILKIEYNFLTYMTITHIKFKPKTKEKLEYAIEYYITYKIYIIIIYT